MTNNKDLFYGILYLMLCIACFFYGSYYNLIGYSFARIIKNFPL